MKSIFTILCACIFAYTMAQDTASFTTVFSTTCIIDSTVFLNTSLSTCGTPSGYFWDFDDGNTSTLENPKHLYMAASTYNVQLIVTWPCAPNDTIVNSVLIVNGAPPDASWGGTPLPELSCFPANPNLIISSFSGANFWYWNWGDGTIDTITGFQFWNSHIYADTGIYYLDVTLERRCGLKSLKDTTDVRYPPVAGFDFTPKTFCTGLPINFIDTSNKDLGAPIVAWDWEFGDGFADTMQNPIHTYVYNENFEVILTVTNEDGCTASIKDTVPISTDTTLANINYGAVCPCNELNFSANGAANTWLWEFGDGVISTSSNPNHKYNLPGNYYINLTGIDTNGCSFTKREVVNVCSGDTLFTSKSNNNWRFYHNRGLDFSSGSPIITTSQMNDTFYVPEACASISDPITGNLLFYTNGEVVWDATNTIMPNGTGLAGHSSTEQGALVIPDPSNINKYYIILNSGNYVLPVDRQFAYAVVDMSLNGGVGDVELATKNTFLSDLAGSEALSGTIGQSPTCSADGEYWFVVPYAHLKYKTYKIDNTGLQLANTQVFTAPLSITPGPSISQGTSAFSPNGKKYAKSRKSDGFFLYDFDINTGLLSNQVYVKSANVNPVGGVFEFFCFSPNNRYLYSCSNSRIYQFDMYANNIEASAKTIFIGAGMYMNMWAGDDGKIYIAHQGFKDLLVINNPNAVAGSISTSVFSMPGTGWLGRGLQNNINLNIPITDTPSANFIIDSSNCLDIAFINTSDSTNYSDPCSFLANNDTLEYNWDFGDGGTSNQMNPIHIYGGAGTYDVQLIVNRPFMCTADTIVQTLTINVPIISFSSDTVCIGDTTHFVSSINGNIRYPISYNWSSPLNDTVVNPNYIFTIDSTYNIALTVTDSAGCDYTNINNVLFKLLPIVYSGSDTTICKESDITLSAGTLLGTPPTNYTWSPNINLNNSTISNPTATPLQNTTYNVLATNECGTDTASTTITVQSCEIYIPNAFSPNGDGYNDVFQIRGEGINKILLIIYDRWGNKVFESKNVNEVWDAVDNNKGVYVYRFEAELLSGETLTKVGNITLVK